MVVPSISPVENGPGPLRSGPEIELFMVLNMTTITFMFDETFFTETTFDAA